MVVICDDKIDSYFASICCLCDGRDAVVDSDDEIDSLLLHHIDMLGLEAVAIVATMREHDRDIVIADVLGDESIERP